jgi:hypothetical protein
MTISELQVLLCKYPLDLKLLTVQASDGNVYIRLPEAMPAAREEADKNFLKGMGIQA